MQPANGSIVRGPRRRSRDRLETQNAREDSRKWGADSRSEEARGEGLHFLRAVRDAAVRGKVDFGRLLPQHQSSREHPSIGPLRHGNGQTPPLPSAPSCIRFIYGVTRWEGWEDALSFLLFCFSVFTVGGNLEIISIKCLIKSNPIKYHVCPYLCMFWYLPAINMDVRTQFTKKSLTSIYFFCLDFKNEKQKE